MKAFSEGAGSNGARLLVAGDKKSPDTFELQHTDYMDVVAQQSAFPGFADEVPYNSYARKNIGYLTAVKNGAEHIIDTDDDNAPYKEFWESRSLQVTGRMVADRGWVNAYKYFTDANIWPRGLPLDKVLDLSSTPATQGEATANSPIQQGLADDNPDVDAIYRLVLPLPLKFEKSADLILGKGAWCPFNSQNTHWWPQAFPLLYLPSYCSFRMTDIWRSFVAQRVLWENDWLLSFHKPTVYQDRNEHNLMRDFADEVPGYLQNTEIAQRLEALSLKGGQENLLDDLITCYDELISMGAVGKDEAPLVRGWAKAFNEAAN